MPSGARACSDAAVRIEPQPGPQTEFLRSSADITIYGGAAGGGKTFGLLLEPLYGVGTPGFGSVIFRRTYPEITSEGSLWDTSFLIYPICGATAKETDLSWSFPPHGDTVSFAHAEHEKDVYKYQGSQICMIGFDQVESFTEFQFFYLLSRNRSVCGIRPCVRATCNPDPDSWVHGFISWWLDSEGRFPDPEKSGRIRWFIRDGDDFVWGDTRSELLEAYPGRDPKSVSFIPASLADNPALEGVDPGYRGRLDAMPLVDRARLLYGDWSIRVAAGNMFRREWFGVVEGVPSGMRTVRCWDLAATEPSSSNRDPDYTVGLLYGAHEGLFYALDVVRVRANPGNVEGVVKHTAVVDGYGTEVGFEQEGGSAGKGVIEHYARDVLPGYVVFGERPTGDKATRAMLPSAAAQHGLIRLVRGAWNHSFLSELEAFPTNGVHDDQVDALSLAHEHLSRGYGQQPGSPVAQASASATARARGIPSMRTDYEPSSGGAPRMR